MSQHTDHDPDRIDRGAATTGVGETEDAVTSGIPDFTRQRAMARSILRSVGLTARGPRR